MKSMILPLPSSPHWAPTRMVLDISICLVDMKTPKLNLGQPLLAERRYGNTWTVSTLWLKIYFISTNSLSFVL